MAILGWNTLSWIKRSQSARTPTEKTIGFHGLQRSCAYPPNCVLAIRKAAGPLDPSRLLNVARSDKLVSDRWQSIPLREAVCVKSTPSAFHPADTVCVPYNSSAPVVKFPTNCNRRECCE